MIPLDGKPKRLRPVTADVEKQQAVVEAFRVSLLLILGAYLADTKLVSIGDPSMLG